MRNVELKLMETWLNEPCLVSESPIPFSSMLIVFSSILKTKYFGVTILVPLHNQFMSKRGESLQAFCSPVLVD